MHQLSRKVPLAQDGPTLFSLRDLRYRYPGGRQALDGVSLDVYPGDRIALVGQNGAGKSTLLKHFNGLLSVQQGSLAYKGAPLTGEHQRQSRLELGLLCQDPDDQLFCNTLQEDVLFGPLNQGLNLADAEEKAQQALVAVGLDHAAQRPPHHLSYGQRKRAALAGLLAMAPEVLLLDEPTANLDPHQEELLLQLLKDFPGTLICITHNLLFAYELCERALVMDRGRVHHDYTLLELVSHRGSLREHGLDFSFRFAEAPPATESSDRTGTRPEADQQDVPLTTERTLLVRLEDYGYTYPDGTEALADLRLSIAAGERLAIVGENGAGKTTLVSCLMGLLPGRGDYWLAGQRVTAKNRRDNCRRVGLVFQDSADQLFCPSCYEEVAFGPRQLGLAKEEIRQRVAKALYRVGLEGFDERVPLQLSGGERKRLALAAVLAMQPEILILDEPTAGLDPEGEERLLGILEQLEVTLVLVSHDLYFVRRLTNRTLVLHEGRLVQDYSTTEFFNDANLTTLNQLDFTYRNRCGLEIMQLQHTHEHSHRHQHLHDHPHRHGDLVHSHPHEHVHDHPHRYTHSHQSHDHDEADVTHGHLVRPDRPHDHDHPDHDQEPHDHEH